MSAEEFRALGYRLVDRVARYWEEVGSLPVMARTEPGEVLGMLPREAPEEGEGWDEILGDVERVVLPRITHWQSPNFFGYFPANVSGPGVLGELLSAGLGVNGMLWATSPAATELEMRVVDWVGRLLGLPEKFLFSSSGGEEDGAAGGGVIQGTASESTLVAMLAARRRVLAGREAGAAARLVAYASGEAHSSFVKAAMICGLARGPGDRSRVRLVETDENFAMRAGALAGAMEEDRRAGLIPFYVCATVGTTASTAVDPLGEIGPVARREGAWLHVDGAHAAAACVCPEMRWLLAGVEYADSVCFNPHKWLLTNFDCDLLWTSDRGSLTGALSITPEYLRNEATDSGRVIDYRDWQIPLGRRFRALKLWFVLRHYGASGLRAYIREHLRLAGWFERRVREDPLFELAAPRTVNLVCFRLRAGSAEESDRLNRALLERVNGSGRALLTHAALGLYRVVPRVAIGGTLTREEHVRGVWELLRGTAEEVCSGA